MKTISLNLTLGAAMLCGIVLIVLACFPALRAKGVEASPIQIDATWSDDKKAFVGSFELINGTSEPVEPALEGGCGCESTSLPQRVGGYSQVTATVELPLHKSSAGSHYIVPLVDKRTRKSVFLTAYLRAPLESP